ncbi:MAG: hypothetical protein PUI48_04845 [Oscillospiraceae bacterium]|nr:hypothetical protein [Oscillospiraceae bacterium]MDY6207484.1 hypothetical protein [Oscillospiraceae bacterium]
MDERELIAQMDRNQRLMIRIDKLFYVTGFLCVIINGVVSLFDMISIPIHLGTENIIGLLESLLAPVSVVFSIFSSCKREKWTVYALAVFLLRVIFVMISQKSFMMGVPFLLLFALPQFLCMRQYKVLSVLKGQFGYPGFNSEIYMHKPNRRTSGEEFASRMKRAKKNPESTRMDDIKPPPTSGDYEDIFTHRKKPL